MIIETDRLAELAETYIQIFDLYGEEARDITDVQEKAIDNEIQRLFGSYVCYASSLEATAGLNEPDDICGDIAVDYNSFYGVNPVFRTIVYPQSSLENDGLLPSLVFETHTPKHHDEEFDPGSLMNLFPYAAIPLTLPLYIEAVARL